MTTRDRILHTSLLLFNEVGEPNVTTIDISNEMDISPGNLYYHYRGKEEIIQELFNQFEAKIMTLLEAPGEERLEMEDNWLYLHMIFECINEYRFLYRDLNDLLGRMDKLRSRFNRILNMKVKASRTICENLVDAGFMQASKIELDMLAENIVITATYWLNYQSIRNVGSQEVLDLGKGAYQVISLFAPFLNGEQRALLQELAKAYIE